MVSRETSQSANAQVDSLHAQTEQGASLKTRSYFSWLTADTGLAASYSLRNFILPLIAFAITQDVAQAGWISATAAIIYNVVSIVGGVVVDRYSRRDLMLIYAASSTIIWSIAGFLLMINQLQTWQLVACAIANALIVALVGDASDAYLRSIINIKDYPQARSINEGRDATVSMISGPVGGFLYAFTVWLPLLASVIMSIASFVATLLIPGAQKERQRARLARQSSTSFWGEFLYGWKWAFTKRTLVWTMAMTCLLNFGFGGIEETAQLHLVSSGVSSQKIGFIDAAWGIAMIIGAIISTKISGKLHVGKWSISIMAFMAVCYVPFIFTDNYYAMMALFAISCLPLPLLNAMTLGYIYAKVPENMQGRVTTALGVPAAGLMALAPGVSGLLLKYFGWNVTIVFFIVWLCLGLATFIASKELRTIPRAELWDEHEMM